MKCPKCHSENPSDSQYCSKCATQLIPPEEISAPDTETVQAPIKELTRGTTFAKRYEIVEELGKGGMGKVYRVDDKKIKEEVALKLLKPEIASDEKTIVRFSNELKLARKISHRNVCRMYDLSEEEGTHFITMEYVSGEDLKSTIKRVGQLSVGKAVSVAKQICEGLIEAHRLGVVHRDLKPQNIMLDKEGNARIMDFGIARSIKAKGITDAGMIIGTPEYMSPEQVEGKEADQTSDVYALGVILYEMVTGKVPFKGDTPLSIAVKQKSEVPRNPKEINPQIPEDLQHFILKCIQKDKEDRYQSARETYSELDKIEGLIPTEERVIPEKKLEIEPLRKRLNTFILPGILIIVAAVIIGGYFLFSRILKKEEPKEPTPISEMKWENSIAVLPFVDLSPQKDQEYFCDGMTDDIISKLSRLEVLKVSSRTSVMRYKKADKDIKEIGQELGVATILEGSIQKENNRIRVSAQLINVEDNFQLWAQTYDRKLESVFDLQDDISKAIAEALKIRLTETETAELGRVPTESVDAYEFYLQGRSLFYTYEKAKNKQAITMFKRALDLDSSFSLAYAGLSLSYSQYINSGWDEDDKWLVLAEDAAKKAINFDANSAEAQFALGFVYEQREAYEIMERVMQLVLELNPNHAHAHDSLGDIFSRARGRLEDALREYSLALKIDPFLLPSFWGINDIRIKQGKYRDAKEILLQALIIHENHELTMILLSRIHRFLEEYGHSIELLKKAVMINPSRIEAHLDLGLTYVLMKKYKNAHAEAEFIAEIANIPEEKNLSYLYLIGWIFLEQRNWEAALENFEQALRARRAISKEKKKWFDVTIENISNAIAETYLRQERLNEAIKEYRRMSDLPTGWLSFEKPSWAIRHYKMATAYGKMNDLASAKREYESFLLLWKDADPDIPEIIDAKKRLAALRTQ
jgi:serine/threonine protein kinase/Tfp pilus assembly protein PilF